MDFQITMPYIGGVLSDNSYKVGRKKQRTRFQVKFWMNELAEKASKLEIPKSDYYRVRVSGRFLDERRPDISNLFKVIADALKKGLDKDDKWFRMEDGGYELNIPDQEIVIIIVPEE